jgi:hypothetical protein
MQGPEHQTYRLFSTGRRVVAFDGICNRTDRRRGEGQVQVSAFHSFPRFFLTIGALHAPRYPHVATEVLCSEIWSIVETCVNHANQLLVPFWETVLDRSPEEMKTQMVLASHFAKINSVFLVRKPAEVSLRVLAEPLF